MREAPRKGEQITKDSAHARVRAKRGKAAEQLCEHCGEQAKEWSLIHGEPYWEPESYQPLCVPCHAVYDTPLKSRGESHWNARLSDEQVKEIRTLYATGEYSQVALANKFGTTKVNINGIVHGRYRKENENG